MSPNPKKFFETFVKLLAVDSDLNIVFVFVTGNFHIRLVSELCDKKSSREFNVDHN